jgi:hypothetical protein
MAADANIDFSAFIIGFYRRRPRTDYACRNFEAGRKREFHTVLEGDYVAFCARVTISTFLSAKCRFTDRGIPLDEQQPTVNIRSVRMVSKMLSPWQESTLMGKRIADRAIVTIQVISQGAIIIATGMILTVIVAGIYESLRTLH